LILRSTAPADSKESRKALEDLCEIYWYPLYAWLRKTGYDQHEAQDLTQSFFVYIFETNLFRQADGNRGRLRTFLLITLRRHVADLRKADTAQKRGGKNKSVVAIDEELAERRFQREPLHAESPDRIFERRWALTVMEKAMTNLRKSYLESDQAELLASLTPFLSWNARTRPQAEVAEQLSMTAGAFRVALNRLRGRFRRAVREEVAHTVDSDAEIDEEIEFLFRALQA